jgi:hypothetical protein
MQLVNARVCDVGQLTRESYGASIAHHHKEDAAMDKPMTLEQVREHCEHLNRAGLVHGRFEAKTILALLDAYEASARDAEMYRYIRESQAEFVHYIGCGTHGLYEGIELDRRVSAAITEEVGRNAPKGE